MSTGIYKREEMYWIRYTDMHGKHHRESSGSKKYNDAKALITERRKAIDEGKEIEYEKRLIGKYTFEQLTEKYLPFCLSLKGYAKKKSVVKLLNDKFKLYPLRNLTLPVLEVYQSELQAKYAPATVNKRMKILRHMLSKASDWNMVEDEVRRRAYKVKLQPENNGRLRFLQKSECVRLIDNCADHLRPIVTMALHTGMRRGEILSLRWDNVDLHHRFIFLGSSVTKTGQRREIPISDLLAAVLTSLPRQDDIPWVFFDKHTKKHIGDVKRSFATACKNAGIKDFHFHDLRHTFASHLVMAGVDITTVSRLLGHTTLKMTLRYAHLAPGHLSAAIEALSKRISGTPALSLTPAKKTE